MLITGNNRLIFKIKIVHDLSCHPKTSLSASCMASWHQTDGTCLLFETSLFI